MSLEDLSKEWLRFFSIDIGIQISLQTKYCKFIFEVIFFLLSSNLSLTGKIISFSYPIVSIS